MASHGNEWNSAIRSFFQLEEQDIRTYSPLTLAYIGDSIFDLIVRSILVNRGNTQTAKIHEKASKIVNARSQALFVETLLPLLTNEEERIYQRGKNAKPHSVAKNASRAQYHKATGFEALLGYLYLTDQMERLFFLVEQILIGNNDYER